MLRRPLILTTLTVLFLLLTLATLFLPLFSIHIAWHHRNQNYNYDRGGFSREDVVQAEPFTITWTTIRNSYSPNQDDLDMSNGSKTEWRFDPFSQWLEERVEQAGETPHRAFNFLGLLFQHGNVDPSFTYSRIQLNYLDLAFLLAIPTALLVHGTLRRWQKLRRRRDNLCQKCGYDLRAHSPNTLCPECGAPVPSTFPS